MLDLALRTLAEYEQSYQGPVSASSGPEGTVIITYSKHVEVLANIAAAGSSVPEPVAIFNQETAKNKKAAKLPFEQFTHAVEFHQEANRFIAVTDGKNLTSWKAVHGATLHTSTTVPAFAPPTFKSGTPASIHSLHMSHRLPKHIVLLDSNGLPTLHQIPLSAGAPNVPVPMAKDDPNVRPIFAHMLHGYDSKSASIPRFIVITWNKKTGEASLNTYVFKTSVSNVNVNAPYTGITLGSSIVMPTPSPGAVLLSADIERVADSVSAYSLTLFWTHGHWQVWSISLSACLLPDASAPSAFTSVQDKQLSTAFHTTNAAASATFLSPQHVLLTAPIAASDEARVAGQALVASPLPSHPILSVIIENTYAHITAFTALPHNHPAVHTPSSFRVVPINFSDDSHFSRSFLILTPTHLYLCTKKLQPQLLSDLVGQAHVSTPFYASSPHGPLSVATITPGAASAQLVTTVAPFAPVDATSLSFSQLSQLLEGNEGVSQTSVTSLLSAWADQDFCEYLQSEWPSYTDAADNTERRMLSRMFPLLNPVLLGERAVVEEESEPVKKRARRGKTAAVEEAKATETIEATPIDFVSAFFSHAAKGSADDAGAEMNVDSYASNPMAWAQLAKSALLYTGHATEVSSVAVVDKHNDRLIRKYGGDEKVETEDPASVESIHFANPLSPLFIALTARYCLHQLHQLATLAKTGADVSKDARLLFLLPVRVLLCSQSLSARIVPQLVRILMDLKQWALVQEAIALLPDIAETELVGMLQLALDGWSASIRPKSEIENAKLITNAARTRKTSTDPTEVLVQSLQGRELTAGYAKLLVLSVLTTKVSQSFLETELRALSITHVLILLRYLLAWIQSIWICGSTGSSTKRFMSVLDRENAVKEFNKKREEKGIKPLTAELALPKIFREMNRVARAKERKITAAIFGVNKDATSLAFSKLSPAERTKKLQEITHNQTFETGAADLHIRSRVIHKKFGIRRSKMLDGVSPIALLAPTAMARPSVDTVINWVNAILDAHFAQIILLINTGNNTRNSQGEQAHEVLLTLREIVAISSSMAQNCQILMPFLRFWDKQMSGKSGAPVPAVSSYSIQLMKL